VRYEGVVFDLDGTVCVSRLSDAEIQRRVADRVGVDLPWTVTDLRATPPDEIETPATRGEFFQNLYRAVVERIDCRLDPDDDADLLAELGRVTAAVNEPGDVVFRDGAESLLAAAHERCAVGLVTNGPESTQRQKLTTLGIEDTFDATVFCTPSGDTPAKPDPAPVQRALSSLDVDPSRAVFVGNDHGTDVVAGHHAGVDTVWVPTNRPHERPPTDPEPTPTHRFDDVGAATSLL
jgi:putative hydrolase of the HAD superfamily